MSRKPAWAGEDDDSNSGSKTRDRGLDQVLPSSRDLATRRSVFPASVWETPSKMARRSRLGSRITSGAPARVANKSLLSKVRPSDETAMPIARLHTGRLHEGCTSG